jgi:hypothetical protein
MSLTDIRRLLEKAVDLCTQLKELEKIASRTSSYASQHQHGSALHLRNSRNHAPSANNPNILQPDHDQDIAVLLEIFDDIANGVTEFRIRRGQKKGFDPLSKAVEPTPKPQTITIPSSVEVASVVIEAPSVAKDPLDPRTHASLSIKDPLDLTPSNSNDALDYQNQTFSEDPSRSSARCRWV